MSDPESYAPPPPPYEPGSRDRKHSLRDDKNSYSKGTASSVSGTIRGPRPLPRGPADTLKSRRSVADSKSYPAEDLLPRSPVGPSLKSSFTPSTLHSSTSVPIHSPSPSSHTPPRSKDDRWPGSPGPYATTSFQRPQPPSYPLPTDDNLGMHLSFDPSVAYADSRFDASADFPAQRGLAASLYSSAVSSHLYPDSVAIHRSRPRPVAVRHAIRSNERLDRTEMQSVRPHTRLLSPVYPMSAADPAFSQTRAWSMYERRWATSESDVGKDIYRG